MNDAAVAAVMGWGRPRLRDLPWRRTRDPWAVLVSEVMLQQTQVARVEPKWREFLAAYPTPADCAAASLGDVLRLWQGLGYPRRARALHATAAWVTQAGEFPSDLAGLLALPGVGAYTARAVMAFAFEAGAGVVDTNTARVFARFAGERLSSGAAQAAADAAVPVGQGWAWNQCLMDLGATVCRPRPSCGECPLRSWCAWRGEGEDPAVGSAGVSRSQSRFEGSERQARGRLLKALVAAPVPLEVVPRVMSHPAARRLADALCSEGLVVRDGGLLRLP